MKTFSRFGLVIFSSALFFNVLVASEARAQAVISEILKRMDAHQKSLSSLRSNVTMQKYDSQLKESDNSEGTAIYLRTSQNQTLARIDWTKPVAESLYFADGKYVLYRPFLKQAIVGKFDKTKQTARLYNTFSFLEMSSKELKANYFIIYIGQEKVKDTPVWHLEFRPKKSDIYKSADLWVNGDGMPVQSKVLEPNNDTTTVTLSDFKKNEAIKFSVFQPSLPRGTTIVKGGDGNGYTCFKPDNARDALKFDADAVFSGKIIAVNGADYTVVTEKVWKGVIGNEEIVRTLSSALRYPQKATIGEQYVFFAQKKRVEDKNILALMPCNLSSLLNSPSGKKILKEIGKGKPVKKAAIRRKKPAVKRSK